MKKYEFKIKRSNVWYDVDLNEVPVMNYQINNLGELENRSVNYSQAFTAPIIPKNSLAFGYPELNDVQYVAPYTTFECRLYVDGNELMGVGSYAILLEVGNVYKLQILGNADFFRLMSDTLMENAAVGTAHWRLEGMDPANFTDMYKYVVYSSISNQFTPFNHSPYQYREKLPVVMFRKLFEYIITSALPVEYSVNYLNEPANIDNVALTLSSLSAMSGYLELFRCYAQGSSTTPAVDELASPDYNITAVGDIVNPLYVDVIQVSGADVNVLKVKMLKLANYTVDLRLNPKTGTSLRVKVSNSAGDVYNSILEGDDGYLTTPWTHQVLVPYNDNGDDDCILTVTIYDMAVDGSYSFYTVVDINAVEDLEMIPNVPLNGIIDFRNNLGFTTCLDVFKAFVNMFGLMVQVNEKTKTVNLCTLAYIIGQRDNAVDWSHKIDINETIEKNYDLGYAQKNIITLERNSVDNITNQGFILCNNQSIEREKTIVTLPFESGIDFTTQNFGTFAKVNQFEIDDETGLAEFKGCRSHALIITDETITKYIRDGVVPLAAYTWNIARHFNMTANVGSNYNGVTQMLTNPLAISTRMLIEPEDIEALNQLTPIYLQQFGKYFYINKISNYQQGQKTEVELIKIIG